MAEHDRGGDPLVDQFAIDAKSNLQVYGWGPAFIAQSHPATPPSQASRR